MPLDQKTKFLVAYEVYVPTSAPFVERLFGVIFVAVLSVFIGLGLYLNSIKSLPQQFTDRIEKIRTQFLIQEQKRQPAPKKKEPKKEEKPIDLTKKPELKQPVDDIKPKTEDIPKPVRRVYGLKKVYSKGIGAGGSLSDAVVGKLGNTLNKDIDTITATKEDVKGEVVSTTTVTVAPRFKKQVKPEYTQQMLDNKVEGVIRVKVLVDVDGRIKKAIAMNDLGYGSKEGAVKACFAMEFEPAMRVDQPVAVWIIIPIKFVLLG